MENKKISKRVNHAPSQVKSFFLYLLVYEFMALTYYETMDLMDSQVPRLP